MTGAAIIGFGFMGRTHARAYADAGVTLAAVCTREAADAERTPEGEPPIDLTSVCVTESLDEALDEPGVSMVSVCTPTDTHEAIAIEALRAGKHVLIEKPVSLDRGAIERIARAAGEAGRICMPAMCMRFWPAWVWVKAAVDDGRFGAVRSMTLQRLGVMPEWNRAFYADTARSGGALFDLHIHDADFILHTLGTPEAVRTVGDATHAGTQYRFGSGASLVTAEGGWMTAGRWPFRMRLTIEFERAVADFDLGRSPELMVHTDAPEPQVPELSPLNGWQAEVAAFARAARNNEASPVPIRDADRVLRVLEAERESLQTGRWVDVPADA